MLGSAMEACVALRDVLNVSWAESVLSVVQITFKKSTILTVLSYRLLWCAATGIMMLRDYNDDVSLVSLPVMTRHTVHIKWDKMRKFRDKWPDLIL